jgi:hypothetical protein
MSRKSKTQRLLGVELFETRLVPAVFPISGSAVSISPDDGGIPKVKIVEPTTGEDLGEVQAYEDSFRGGVHTALGDVNGDGVRDLVIAPGKGGGPRIRIVDGKSGSTLNDFFVYESQFTGGIYVSLGDVNGDGFDDIITGTGDGGGPRVRVLDGKTLGATVLKDYFAYESSFRGGVLVASGDINGDRKADVITGTGVGGGPRVQVFSGADDRVLRNEFAYEDSFRGGVLVASGDTNGDGRDDIICGTGPGGGPVVKVLSGANGSVLSSQFADDPSFRGGVRVDSRDVNGDGRDDIITHLRHGNDDGIRVFDGSNSNFLSSVSRVVDDNPSARDVLEGKVGGVTPGTTSYIEGTFVSVDSASNTVTLRLQSGATATAQVGAGTEIKRDKVRTVLTSFVAGDKVEALIGPNGIAWEVEAKSAAFREGTSGRGSSGSGSVATSLEGTISAVNPTSKTVSIRSTTGVVTVVNAVAGTKIERNNVETTLAAFVVGDSVEAKFGSNGLAIQIEAVSAVPPPAVPPTVPPAPSGVSNAPANSKIEGKVTAIDTTANTVTIRTQSGTLFIARATSGTKIERNNNRTALSAFQIGDFGEAETGSNGFATKIEATQT